MRNCAIVQEGLTLCKIKTCCYDCELNKQGKCEHTNNLEVPCSADPKHCKYVIEKADDNENVED